ncbi:hypothetical protein M885DRAFT_265995 [Pelagophyceae sp. CCMP2097]|nr:hypothetical protein M885DRAFT_265995 [Pelagophyceae sp. CCMP2097]
MEDVALCACSMRTAHETKIVCGTSKGKIRELHHESKFCRNTTAAPHFVPAVRFLKLLKNRVVYAASSQIVGLLALPLDGDPSKCSGLMAHPGQIRALEVQGDLVFTAGGNTVNCFRVVDHKPAQGEDAYLALLRHTEGQTFIDDVADYFYDVQIQSQGLGSTATRDCPGTISIDRLPHLLRALGFFCSEAAMAALLAEVRYSRFGDDGELVDRVDFGDFVKLYFNHRPRRCTTLDEIRSAVAVLDNATREEETTLRRLLTETGDALSSAEIDAALRLLKVDGTPPKLDADALGRFISQGAE